MLELSVWRHIYTRTKTLTVKELSGIDAPVLAKQGQIHNDAHQRHFDQNMAQVDYPAAGMEASCSQTALGEGIGFCLPVLAAPEELLLGSRV